MLKHKASVNFGLDLIWFEIKDQLPCESKMFLWQSGDGDMRWIFLSTYYILYVYTWLTYASWAACCGLMVTAACTQTGCPALTSLVQIFLESNG